MTGKRELNLTKTNLTLVISVLAIVVMCGFALVSCSKVEAGYVGIKVNLLGSDKGVDSEVLPVGRYWIGWNEEIYLFPTFQQTAAWDGNRESGAFQFQSREGLSLSTDVSISFTVNPDMVSVLFQKYRKGITEITNIYLYNIIRDTMVQAASKRTAENLYGEGKNDFIAEVNTLVREKMKPLGINIDYIAIIGNVWLPRNVKAAIDEKVKAGQLAAQRETEVATAKAEAEKTVATAEGEARSKKAIADANSYSMSVEAEGQAKSRKTIAEANAYSIGVEARAQEEANRILATSLTPALIQYNMAIKWNGILPTVTSNAVPFLQLPAMK